MALYEWCGPGSINHALESWTLTKKNQDIKNSSLIYAEKYDDSWEKMEKYSTRIEDVART